MKYIIYKLFNGKWRLEWEDGSFSDHQSYYMAERMWIRQLGIKNNK